MATDDAAWHKLLTRWSTPAERTQSPVSEETVVNAFQRALLAGKPWSTLKFFLTRDARIDPSQPWNAAICKAAQAGDVEWVQRLLRDKRVSPADPRNPALYSAVVGGHLDVVQLLLADPRVYPAVRNNLCVQQAVHNANVEILRCLLADPRTNPAVNSQEAVRVAITNGCTESLRLLLAHPRIDPTREDYLLLAIKKQKVGCVHLLLAQPGVTLRPSDQHYEVMFMALACDMEDLTRLVLQDPCVNPTNTLCMNLVYWEEHAPFKAARLALTDKRTDVTRVLQAMTTFSRKADILPHLLPPVVWEIIFRRLPVPRVSLPRDQLSSGLEQETETILMAVKAVAHEPTSLAFLMLRSVLLEDVRLRERIFAQAVQRMFVSE